MTKIYLAHTLTNASKEAKYLLNLLKQYIEENEHISILPFYGLGNRYEHSGDVYEYNFGQIRKADVVVAVLDYPSLGVGMEIQYALSILKPVLGIRLDANRPLSRQIVGALVTTSQPPILNFVATLTPKEMAKDINKRIYAIAREN